MQLAIGRAGSGVAGGIVRGLPRRLATLRYGFAPGAVPHARKPERPERRSRFGEGRRRWRDTAALAVLRPIISYCLSGTKLQVYSQPS